MSLLRALRIAYGTRAKGERPAGRYATIRKRNINLLTNGAVTAHGTRTSVPSRACISLSVVYTVSARCTTIWKIRVGVNSSTGRATSYPKLAVTADKENICECAAAMTTDRIEIQGKRKRTTNIRDADERNGSQGENVHGGKQRRNEELEKNKREKGKQKKRKKKR